MENRSSGFFNLTAREMYMPGLLQQGLSYKASSPRSCIILDMAWQHVRFILKNKPSPNKTVTTNCLSESMKDGEKFRENNHSI